MPNKYCQKCNKPTSYNDSIPVYCSSCGEPFAGVVINAIASEYEIEEEPVKQTKRTILRRKQKEVDFNEELEAENDSELPRLGKPNNFKITPEELFDESSLPKRQKETLGDLMLDKSPPQIIQRPATPKTKKQFMTEWQAELSKKPSQEIGGH